jgi:hypothetical protein
MHGDYLAVSIAATTHQWLMDEAVSNLSGKWRPDESPSVQLEPERYTVYCADNRIEVSFWDREQMDEGPKRLRRLPVPEPQQRPEFRPEEFW